MTDFAAAFQTLTGHPPFPWQEAMYALMTREDREGQDRWKELATCSLPTGLGKTNVIAVWLVALANHPDRVPRRLVYVVNRRTVVDQATREAEKVRERLAQVPAVAARLRGLAADPDPEADVLAISTLRGQKAESNDWWENPARAAVVVGTIDLIGSRLLFQGYRASFKRRPLFAGFLGQDALLVHDEAHLEHPFQCLIEWVRDEQQERDRWPLKVMALTATPRRSVAGSSRQADSGEPFQLTQADNEHAVVKQRLQAPKSLKLHPVADDKAVTAKLIDLAKSFKDDPKEPPVLVFVQSVKAVGEVRAGLLKAKVSPDSIAVLTGTIRGRERDLLADPRRVEAKDFGPAAVFARFVKPPKADADASERWQVTPRPGTVYLLCTSAGEVGVDISAHHLVCDLSTFDSMAQRFGRVNRYGDVPDTTVQVVHPEPITDKSPLPDQRRTTLALLERLGEKGVSPAALGDLPLADRLAGFAPPPTVLAPTDMLYDAWALTSVCKQLTGSNDLPGRPPVEPYLHGISERERPNTQVAWRQEVEWLAKAGTVDDDLTRFLEKYPLRPHELAQDASDRVREWLEAVAAGKEHLPAWLVSPGGDVTPTTLGELVATRPGKSGEYTISIEWQTVVLPPAAGGLSAAGLLDPESDTAADVADRLFDDDGRPLRELRRVRDGDDTSPPERMKRVFELPLRDSEADDGPADGDDPAGPYTRLLVFARGQGTDDDGSERSREGVTLGAHVSDVVKYATQYATALLDGPERAAVIAAAELHDLGKARQRWQHGIGNRQYDDVVLAKSKNRGGFKHGYRHEFGSLLDAAGRPELAALPDDDARALALHLIATHHGRGRPHFPPKEAFDTEPHGRDEAGAAAAVPRRFARLQRKYGRWGLAYLESILRAADALASKQAEGGAK